MRMPAAPNPTSSMAKAMTTRLVAPVLANVRAPVVVASARAEPFVCEPCDGALGVLSWVSFLVPFVPLGEPELFPLSV